jgi:putative membrane protein
MHRIPRLALVLAGFATASFVAGTARAQHEPTKLPSSNDKAAAMEKISEAVDSIDRTLDRDMTDSELARKIHAINLEEIEIGRLAATTATNKDVRSFADKLAKDHQDADKKLTDTAKKMGIDLTSDMDTDQKMKLGTKVDELRKLSGIDFDRHFLIAMQKGHSEAILLLSAQAYVHPIGKDLRDYIKKSFPVLNDHRKRSLDLLEKIRDKSPPTS